MYSKKSPQSKNFLFKKRRWKYTYNFSRGNLDELLWYDADMADKNPIESNFQVIAFRPERSQRTFSNHIEVTRNDIEIELKFCDIRPPENNDDLEKIKKTGKIRAPIICEVSISHKLAKDLLEVLKKHLGAK